jgi:TonB family protein
VSDIPFYSATTSSNETVGRGVSVSIFAHLAVVALVLIKCLVFPGKTIPYVPTLRVDIVGLPDVLKKDLHPVTETKPESKSAPKPQVEPPSEAKVKPVEKIVPEKTDEMVMKPKTAPSEDRAKKLKNALNRIKALEKVSEQDHASTAAPEVKGNKISKGSSLDGDAKEAAEASYYDVLRDKLRDNWELAPWIQRQHLDAQIRVFIDSHGRVRQFVVVKSSGNPQFDEAVKLSVQQGQPFPTPPDGLVSSLLTDGILVGFPL